LTGGWPRKLLCRRVSVFPCSRKREEERQERKQSIADGQRTGCGSGGSRPRRSSGVAAPVAFSFLRPFWLVKVGAAPPRFGSSAVAAGEVRKQLRWRGFGPAWSPSAVVAQGASALEFPVRRCLCKTLQRRWPRRERLHSLTTCVAELPPACCAQARGSEEQRQPRRFL
jgi:hypothetical protein